MRPTDAATERFIHAENLINFRRKIAESKKAKQQQTIMTLLAEENAKGRKASNNEK